MAHRQDLALTCVGLVAAFVTVAARDASAQAQAGPFNLRPHLTVSFSSEADVTPAASVDLRPGGGNTLVDPQDHAPEPQKPTHNFFKALGQNLVDDVKHLPRRNSLYWLLGGGVAALAVHPLDDEVNQHFAGSGNAFFVGKYVGSTPVQIGAALTTYIVGRVNHHPRAQHIGMDMFEAQLLTEGIVELTKVAVHRPRPTVPEGETQAAGFSFPSGHAAITFATATVFQQHFGWKAAVPTYALATYVSMSRLHDNRHFASDVVFGAAVGVIVGRSVTWHGRNTYTLTPVVLPNGLGASIIW
jgi:membrane-associated phospholipid phosphatase